MHSSRYGLDLSTPCCQATYVEGQVEAGEIVTKHSHICGVFAACISPRHGAIAWATGACNTMYLGDCLHWVEVEVCDQCADSAFGDEFHIEEESCEKLLLQQFA